MSLIKLSGDSHFSCNYDICDEFCDEVYECALCSFLCGSASSFEVHVQEEHKSNFLPCITCGKLYSSSRCLVQHISSSHQDSLVVYRCGKVGCCFKTTASKTFVFHLAKCIQSDFPCYYCRKKFSNPDSLFAHLEQRWKKLKMVQRLKCLKKEECIKKNEALSIRVADVEKNEHVKISTSEMTTQSEIFDKTVVVKTEPAIRQQANCVRAISTPATAGIQSSTLVRGRWETNMPSALCLNPGTSRPKIMRLGNVVHGTSVQGFTFAKHIDTITSVGSNVLHKEGEMVTGNSKPSQSVSACKFVVIAPKGKLQVPGSGMKIVKPAMVMVVKNGPHNATCTKNSVLDKQNSDVLKAVKFDTVRPVSLSSSSSKSIGNTSNIKCELSHNEQLSSQTAHSVSDAGSGLSQYPTVLPRICEVGSEQDIYALLAKGSSQQKEKTGSASPPCVVKKSSKCKAEGISDGCNVFEPHLTKHKDRAWSQGVGQTGIVQETVSNTGSNESVAITHADVSSSGTSHSVSCSTSNFRRSLNGVLQNRETRQHYYSEQHPPETPFKQQNTSLISVPLVEASKHTSIDVCTVSAVHMSSIASTYDHSTAKMKPPKQYVQTVVLKDMADMQRIISPNLSDTLAFLPNNSAFTNVPPCRPVAFVDEPSGSNVFSEDFFKSDSRYFDYLNERKKSFIIIQRMSLSGHFFKCMHGECSYTCNSPESFIKHFEIHENAEAECAYCLKVFPDVQGLVKHSICSHRRRLFQCSLCFYRACTKTHVDAHMQAVHPKLQGYVITGTQIETELAKEPEDPICFSPSIRKIKCCHNDCNYLTNSITDIAYHVWKHPHQSSTFCCMECDTKYHSVLQWVIHQRSHGIHLLHCLFCSYGCDKRLKILNHLITCHADYPLMTYIRTSAQTCFSLECYLNADMNTPFMSMQNCSSPSTCYCYLFSCMEFEGDSNRIQTLLENVKTKKMHFRLLECLYCMHRTSTVAKMEKHLKSEHCTLSALKYYHCMSQPLSSLDIKELFDTNSQKRISKLVTPSEKSNEVKREDLALLPCLYCTHKTSTAAKLERHIKLHHFEWHPGIGTYCKTTEKLTEEISCSHSDSISLICVTDIISRVVQSYLSSAKVRLDNSDNSLCLHLPEYLEKTASSLCIRIIQYFLGHISCKWIKVPSYTCAYCSAQFRRLANLRLHWKAVHIPHGKKFCYYVTKDLVRKYNNIKISAMNSLSLPLTEDFKSTQNRITCQGRSKRKGSVNSGPPCKKCKKSDGKFSVPHGMWLHEKTSEPVQDPKMGCDMCRLRVNICYNNSSFCAKMPLSYLEQLIDFFPVVSLSDVKDDILHKAMKSSKKYF